MKKIGILIIFILLITLSAGALNSPEVDEAIKLAYNFQFSTAKTALDDYQQRNPEDLRGDMGRIVFNFLLVKQNPLKQNFDRISDHLKSTEK